MTSQLYPEVARFESLRRSKGWLVGVCGEIDKAWTVKGEELLEL